MSNITDYIPAQVLEREGFVHISDSAKMLERIDKGFLAEQGWANLATKRGVKVSVRKAAEIVGVDAKTLAAYIKSGYLAADEMGRVSIVDALTFNYEATKRVYLTQKKA